MLPITAPSVKYLTRQRRIFAIPRSFKTVSLSLLSNSGISAAFEHHDHTYNRTHPLVGGKVQNEPTKGVTYLGDGALGASIRKVRPPVEVPHIAKSQSVNHVFFFEIGPAVPLRFQAINSKGEMFDRFELPRRR